MLESQIFDAIGEEGLRRIVAGFYRRVPTDPVLGPLYPARDLAAAEQRLAEFLLFRFGGFMRYIERRGHPRLGMRHGRFPIDQKARDQWMKLMTESVEEAEVPREAAEPLLYFFSQTATFLINRTEPGA